MSQIAIDGPAGAGKSTVAREVSKCLGFMYVDTGAMYRTIALECIKKGIDLNNEELVSSVCEDSKISIKYIDSVQHMYIADEDVSSEIRTEEAGKGASMVAKYAAVRRKLVSLQQELGREYNVVMDGRDICSCVLPNADLKIFLTASAGCRAKRRYDELISKGIEADLEEIKEDIENRDYNDSHRKISPLKKAPDATEIDTSDMTIEEATNAVIKLWK